MTGELGKFRKWWLIARAAALCYLIVLMIGVRVMENDWLDDVVATAAHSHQGQARVGLL